MVNDALIKRYESIRNEVPNGSILLVRGSSALSKSIQWADNAYFNHSALVFKAGERLMVLDSNATGVKPEFLSQRIGQYIDFAFLIPIGYKSQDINRAVDLAIAKDLQKDFKYDFSLLPKVLINKKLKLPVNHNLDSNRSICSVFTGYHYGLLLGEYNWVNEAIKKNYFTPQDHIRFISDRWKILTGK